MGGLGQELLAWILPLLHCGVKRNEHHRLWWGCEVESLVSGAKRAASLGSDRFLKNPFLEVHRRDNAEPEMRFRVVVAGRRAGGRALDALNLWRSGWRCRSGAA
jgi:hypothetical protein